MQLPFEWHPSLFWMTMKNILVSYVDDQSFRHSEFRRRRALELEILAQNLEAHPRYLQLIERLKTEMLSEAVSVSWIEIDILSRWSEAYSNLKSAMTLERLKKNLRRLPQPSESEKAVLARLGELESDFEDFLNRDSSRFLNLDRRIRGHHSRQELEFYLDLIPSISLS